ncbi:MAG: hypothetical protein ACLP05_12355 [Candidatus Kryptoniota bacterium]
MLLRANESTPAKPYRAAERLVIAFLLLAFAGFMLYKLVFMTTSVSFESYPKRIFIYSSSPVTVKVIALNRLGFGIPFKRLNGKFVVKEGREIIEIVGNKRDELVFRTTGTGGRLVVLYYTPTVPYPVEIILNIGTAALAGKNVGEFLFCATCCCREHRSNTN